MLDNIFDESGCIPMERVNELTGGLEMDLYDQIERLSDGMHKLRGATLSLVEEAECALRFIDRHWQEHEMLPEDMEASPDGLAIVIRRAREACSADSEYQANKRAEENKKLREAVGMLREALEKISQDVVMCKLTSEQPLINYMPSNAALIARSALTAIQEISDGE